MYIFPAAAASGNLISQWVKRLWIDCKTLPQCLSSVSRIFTRAPTVPNCRSQWCLTTCVPRMRVPPQILSHHDAFGSFWRSLEKDWLSEKWEKRASALRKMWLNTTCPLCGTAEDTDRVKTRPGQRDQRRMYKKSVWLQLGGCVGGWQMSVILFSSLCLWVLLLLSEMRE